MLFGACEYDKRPCPCLLGLSKQFICEATVCSDLEPTELCFWRRKSRSEMRVSLPHPGINGGDGNTIMKRVIPNLRPMQSGKEKVSYINSVSYYVDGIRELQKQHSAPLTTWGLWILSKRRAVFAKQIWRELFIVNENSFLQDEPTTVHSQSLSQQTEGNNGLQRCPGPHLCNEVGTKPLMTQINCSETPCQQDDTPHFWCRKQMRWGKR